MDNPLDATMSQIRVERQRGYFGMLRTLEVIVDGVKIGKIDQGQTLTFDAPEACREIWGKMDWGETDRLDITNYTLAQTVVFKGRFTFNIFKNLGLTNMPFAVHLREEPSD
jgi:hypothetical protein